MIKVTQRRKSRSEIADDVEVCLQQPQQEVRVWLWTELQRMRRLGATEV